MFAVVGLVLTAAACGGGKATEAVEAKSAGDGGTTTTEAAGDGAAPAKGGTDSKVDTKAAAGSTVDAPAGATTTTPASASDFAAKLVQPGPRGRLEVKATLDETCVRPGGTQGITILTQPKTGVGYDTAYADGKTGMMEGHHGGNFGGQTDDDGTWSDTWVVAPTAPAGKAEVRVLAGNLDYGSAQTTLSFTVADATGTCR